ncbi:MAG: tetratricopeptide repeat protein [Phycisphaerales bacterium]
MATTKVNKNFVVLLVTGIVAVVAGLGGTAAFVFMRSGERNISRGDAFMAAGDYGAAQKAYSRAVNRDRSRVDWLNKWRGALDKWVPATDTEYRQAYQTYYLGVLRTIAIVQNKDPKSQRDFIEELDAFMRKGSGGQVEPIKSFLRDVEERLKTLDENDPETKKLLRFRGLARVDIMGEQPLPDEEKAQALKDLQAAFAADPTDWETKLAEVRWHLVDAQGKASARRMTEADEARAKANEVLSAYLKENPNQPEALILQFVMNQQAATEKAVTIEDKVAVVKATRPAADELMTKMESLPGEQIRTDTLWQVVARIRTVLGADGATRTLGLADKALAVRPSDPDLLMLAAEMTYETGNLEDTIARFQKVADLKDLPVSRTGMLLPHMRRVAAGRQVDTALDMWRKAKNEDEKTAAMAKAVEYRDRLKTIIDVNSQGELKLRDAYIAIAKGDNNTGIALLAELRSQASKVTDHRVLLPLAEALNRAGSMGDAVQIYDRLIDGGYLDAGVLAAAGLIHLDLQNIDKATDYLRRAQALEPDNKALREITDRIRQLQAASKGDIEQMQDPVVREILRIGQTMTGGDLRQARSAVEELYKKNPKDWRVVKFYVNFLMQDDNRGRALEVLDKAIADQPENSEWPKLKLVVQSPDRDAAMLALIDAGPEPEHEKLVSKYQIFNRKGMLKEAEEAYQKAIQLKPDAEGVVEMAFMRQIGKIVDARAVKNNEARAAAESEAQKFVNTATERNLDQMQGSLYKARLLMAQEQFRDAAALVRQAVDRNPNNPQAWRLLGLAHMESGQVNEGLSAFQRALEGQPNNGAMAKDYVRALVRVARGKDALEIIRPETGVLKFSENGGDEELVDMWLELEAQQGGPAGVAKAIERRRVIFNRKPNQINNASSLCRLLIDADRFEEAQKVLEGIEKIPDVNKEMVVRLKADWFAAQKKFEEGEQVFKDHLAALGDKATVTPWLMYAGWQQAHGRREPSIAVLQEARKLQTKAFEADRQLGDLMFNGAAEMFDDAERRRARRDPEGADKQKAAGQEALVLAEQSYRAIIEGDADDPSQGFPVTKRMVETLIRLERFEDASKTLDRLKQVSPPEQKVEQDLQYLLLRGAVADKLNKPSEARKFYDQAVERYPGDHRPFISRAMLNSRDQTLFPDAVADLTQVTKLIPASPLAWNMLFVLHEQRGMTDQAYALLTKAVDQNPNNDALNKLYVERLTQGGLREQAVQHMLRMVARDKKPDPAIIRSTAQYCLLMDKYREAAEMYKLLMQQDGFNTVDVQSLYLHCLLRRGAPFPEKGEVGELLREISKDAAAGETQAGIMLRARAEAYLGATDKGMELAKKGYKLAENSNAIYAWFTETVEMFWLSLKKGNTMYRELPDGRRQAQRDVFDRFRSVRAPLPPMMVIMEIPFRQAAGEPLSKLVEELVKLDPQVKDDGPARIEMFRALNQLYYGMNDYEKSLQACKDGLALRPDDAEFNNNAAYTLSKHLNRAAEALPFAQNAAKGMPNSSAVLDTLGQIYLQLGDVEKAIESLVKAVDFAARPDEIVAANLHLGEARLLMKPTPDIGAARKCFDRARETFLKMPETARKQFEADLESLRRKVQ